MDLSRRELLGITAVGTTGALAVANPTTPKTEFNILQSEVRKRRKIRENNSGATIHLGSINTVENTLDGGTVYDNRNFDRINQMLDQGMEPEKIVDQESGNLRHRNGQQEAQPIRKNSDNVKLVYLTDDQEIELQNYAETLQDSFQEFEPSLNLEIKTESYILDQNEKRTLQNVTSQENSLHARLELRDKLSEYGTLPIFLLDQNIFEEADGKEFSFTDTAFVELSEDREINNHLIVHEAGHSILGLPHHYHQNGAMSYNPEADRDSSFHQRTQMIGNSLLNGNREFDVRQQVYEGTVNGENVENPYKLIDIEYVPKIIDSSRVEEDFFRHFETFTEEVLEYEMSEWDREKYRLVEEDGDLYDLVTYSHKSGAKMTLKVDDYIDEMEFQAP